MVVTGYDLRMGKIIPKYYGVSYRGVSRDIVVCHLWPFNILIGFGRKIWFLARYYYVPIDKEYLDIYKETVEKFRLENDDLRRRLHSYRGYYYRGLK